MPFNITNLRMQNVGLMTSNYANVPKNLTRQDYLNRNIQIERDSIASYFDSTGTLQYAGVDESRFDYDPSTLEYKGLLVEDSATNLLLNSETPTTQTVSLDAGVYTVSFYGTGSVILSGTHSKMIYGEEENVRATYTIVNDSTGSLTLTVEGSVNYWQLEEGEEASSFIPTQGTVATRSADLIYIDSDTDEFDDGTFLVEYSLLSEASNEDKSVLSIDVNDIPINVYANETESASPAVGTYDDVFLDVLEYDSDETGLNSVAVTYNSNNYTAGLNSGSLTKRCSI